MSYTNVEMNEEKMTMKLAEGAALEEGIPIFNHIGVNIIPPPIILDLIISPNPTSPPKNPAQALLKTVVSI